MTTQPAHRHQDKDTVLFAQAVARLSTLLDTHLWGQNQRSANKVSAAQTWKNCFCALVLTLNADNRVTDTLEALPPDAGELDETAVLNAMANLGHFSRALDMPVRQCDGRLAPCLVIPAIASNPPYAVIARHGDTLTIYDPADGGIHQHSARDARFSQPARIWFFQPYDRQRQRLSRFIRQGTGQTWFRALLSRFSPTLRHILLIGLALNITALAPPLYMMAVYDRVVSPAYLASLPAITIGALIALCAEYGLRNVRARALSWLSARLDTLVGTQIFAHLLGLAPHTGEKMSVAAQIARIKTFESIRDLFSGAIFLSFLEIPYVILALALIAVIAGPLALVPALMAVCFAVLFAAVYKRTRVVIRLAAKASSARQQFTLETFDKLAGIHANGLAAVWQAKYADLTGREVTMNMQLAWLGTIAETLAHALTLLAAVATVGYGAHLVWQGAIGTGALIASMMLVWRVLMPFYSLCAMVTRLEQLRNSIAQVNDLTDVETEEETAHSAARLLDIRGDISFANVTMQYHSDSAAVLHHAGLHVRSGEIVGITGRNGSGKSTIFKLIKGLYHAQAGAVHIDGFDVRQLDPLHLRRHIGYVGQQAEFFTGSVIQNLRFARPLASEAEVLHALALADALDDVHAMDGGLQAQITPQKLPHSLAARLSLARGYLHGGSILLIDELPASITTGKAGETLRRFINRVRGQRTVIFVSQQQDILALADSVIEIRDGQIAYLARSTSPAEVAPDADIAYFTPPQRESA